AMALAEAQEKVALATVTSAHVAVEEAALRLSRMTIRSPMDGIVQRRLKRVGDKVMLGMDGEHTAHLFHLYDPARLQVRVDVALEDASHVRVGQTCEVVVEVLPGEVFRGEVLRLTHEADIQKNTLEVKVKILDPSPWLRPEMLARVTFVGAEQGRSNDADESQATVRLPGSAFDGSGHVWVVRDRRSDRGTLHRVDVTSTDAGDEGWRVATGAIRPGDLVVVKGLEDLKEGRSVRMVGGT
ncbi:MAG: efflux RND transporter periplasmic adaptor subunit, partial [Phycisphaerales bacterium]|nr:efflux RND transporter periplasmic adaptor subunit [Phycisphaerales bacterium]